MARNAYALGRAMLWRRNVEAAMAEFAACRTEAAPRRPALPGAAQPRFERADACAG